MGRSKFPGKPTKHSNRTRINVITGSINVLGQSNLLNVDQSQKNGVIYLSENDLPNAEGTPNSTGHTAGSIYPSPQISPRKKRATGIHNKRSIFNKNGAKLDSTSPHITCNKRSIRVFSKSRKATNIKTSVAKFENNSVGGKFVLPSRSIHSSRVIKPNKRFMNVAESPDSRSSFKKRPVVSKRHSIKSSQQLSKIQVRKVVTTGVDHGDKSLKEAVPESRKSCSTVGGVVLRQARFQVNRSSSGSSSTYGSVRSSDGPFTTMSTPPISAVFNNASGLCSVCGVLRSTTAVRLRKRNKTTRRLNMSVTCESCRVFLANVIQRRDVLSCVCSHEQTVLEEPTMPLPTQCSACWLNACLRTFQLPLFFKNTLIKLLPRNMQIQSGDVIFGSSPPPLLSWRSHHRISSDDGVIAAATAVPNDLATATTADYPPQPVTSTIYKRQKVDLKGPRVKHVCRSASIVLGQMAATFDTASVTASIKTQTPVSSTVVVNTPNATVRQVPEDACINLVAASATTTTTNVTSTASSLQQSKRFDHKQSKLKSTVSTLLGLQYFAPSRSSGRYGHNQEKPEKSCNAIAVDFWESYDVEEVCRNGFGLTGTVPFSLKAICFLCGSGGCEILLHCCICCEPYHPYCLEQTPPIFRELSDRFNWLCPRCTTCSACGLADRQKINCQKCHKTYHPQCFNTKWRTDDRPTVCSNCLRCKSCGTDNITKFVGNLALCLLCFKLRNKGNFCPLCQRCYDDNDFDTKMMECSKCKKWVHSKCEGLSDEQYQILSILPESVEFHCCLCSSSSTPYWRKAIQAELKNSFNTILRLLNKNQIARPLLKLTLTPVKSGADEDTEVEDGCGELATFSRKLHFDVSDGQLFSGAVVRRACIEAAMDQQQQPKTVPTAAPLSPNITDIRRRITRNEYFSLRDFNTAMHQTVLHTSNSTQLLHIYHMVLKKVFPWFDPAASHEDTAEDEDLHAATALVGCDVDEPGVRLDYVVPVALGSPSCIPDMRMCALCKSVGDGPPQKQARLLYCGHNEWIHANCALWSSEVYEEIDGSLQNVHSAINRGKSIKCTRCKLRGASVGCCLKGCYESYHFVCAQMARCHFLTDRSIYCQNHVPPPPELIGSSDFDFDIRRSVYVELDAKKRKLADSFKVNYIVGSLTVLSLGKLCENVSDNMLDVLIPTGFVCSRLFWSTKSPSQLVPYIIKTSVLKPARSNTFVQVDHNFTIDHTLPTYVVNKKLNELSAWLKSDDNAQADVNSNNVRIVPSTTAATISDNTAGAVMVTTGPAVDEEEPQNGGDILSPELTDAILQELPHGLLDGLMSMDFNKNSADMSCGGGANDLNGNVSVLSGIGGGGPVRKRRMPLAPPLALPPRDNLYLQHLLVDGPCDDTSSSEYSEEDDDEDDDDDTTEVTAAADIDQPVTCDKCKCTYRTSASYKRHLDSCCDAIFTSESDEEDVLVAWRPPVITDNLGHSAVIDVVASQQQPPPPQLSIVQPSLVQSFPEPTTTYTSYETFTTNTFQQRNDTTVVPSTSHLQLHHQQAFVSCESATTGVADVAFADNPATSTTILNSYQSQPKTFFTNELTTPHHSMVPLNGTDTHYCTLNQTIPINQVHLSLNNHHPSLNVQTNGYTDEVIMPQQQQHAYTIDTSKLLNSHLMNVNMNVNMAENHQWLKSSVVSPSLKTAILNSINNDSRATHQQQHIILARKPKMSNNTQTATVILSTGQNTLPSTLLHSSPCQSVYLQQPQQNQQQQPQHTGNIMSIGSAFMNANGNIQYHLSSLPPPQPPPVSSHMNTINSQPQIIQIATSGHSHSQVAATATSSTNMLSIMPNVQSQANTCHDGLNVYATSENSITSQSAGHFIIDANGCMLWTPAATTSTTTALQQHRPQSTTIELQQSQPQQTPPPPLYYGFETIVQNTVMQSQHQQHQHQHILPTTSLLSTNSSYSTTTQVFQTNKLEPTMLEVSHGGFVLVNAANSGGNGSSNNNTTYPSHRIVAATATAMQPVAGAAYSTVHPATPLRQDQHKSLVHATSGSLAGAGAGAAAALTKLQSIVIAAAPVLPAQHKSINNRYVRAAPVLTPQLPPPQPSDSHRQQRQLPQLPPPLNALKAAPLLVKSQPKKVAPPVPVQVQVRVVQKQVTPKVPPTNSSLVSTAPSQPPLSLPPPLALPADTTNMKVMSCAQSLLKPAAAVVNVYASPKSVTKYRPVSRVLPMPTTSNVPKQQPSHHKSVSATRLPTTVQQKQMPPPPQLPLAPEKIPHTEMKTKKATDDLVIVQSTKHRFDPPPPLEIKKVQPPPPLAMRMEEVPPLQLPLSPNKAATATVPDTEVNHKHSETDIVMRIESNSIVAATAVKNSERNHNNADGKADVSTTTASVNNHNSDTEEILYTVETHDGFKHSSTSLYELWAKVFEAVQTARKLHNMSPLPDNALQMIGNLQLLGLRTNGLRYLVEQLPGRKKCAKYKPMFNVQVVGRGGTDDQTSTPSSFHTLSTEFQSHREGCVRLVPLSHSRKPYDMFGWLASKHRMPDFVEDVDPLPRKAFPLHTVSMGMRYRQLKETCKIAVGVYPSAIHGRGLFAKTAIESGDMVIEYAGEVIRSVLTDKREKYYNSKGIGCYMFRIDEDLVVDSTMKGNSARFINHSCDPNCYSKVVEFHGHKHIIIFALRRIPCGEELTYDYKFPIEDDKILCSCGTKRCRKFLN